MNSLLVIDDEHLFHYSKNNIEMGFNITLEYLFPGCTETNVWYTRNQYESFYKHILNYHGEQIMSHYLELRNLDKKNPFHSFNIHALVAGQTTVDIIFIIRNHLPCEL